ncbi:MAG TPA: substrate-binding domain-containing protein, partial [Tepidisphaeraceae bacterium]
MTLRNILVVISLALSIVIGVVLARGSGAAIGPAGTSKPRIGLSLDTLKEARWQADRDLFVKRASELGAEVFVNSANSDDTRQVNDVQGLISRGVDVMVIVPHDGLAMAKAVEICHAAKIPVIAYDRIIKNADLDLYLSFDNEKVGELQAKYLVDHLPGGKGRIVRIYGAKTDNNAFQFKAGQDKVVKPLIERGDIQVIHEDWAEDWKPENAKRILNAAITSKGKDFVAVLA